jgi:hypothetical protein
MVEHNAAGPMPGWDPLCSERFGNLRGETDGGKEGK